MRNWRRFLVVVLLSLSLALSYSSDLQAQVNPAQLVRQAQQQYDRGKSIQALTLLQQAEKIYRSRQAILPQIQILTLTSLVQQQQRNWQLASASLERAKVLIEPLPNSNHKTQVSAQIWHGFGHYNLATGQSSRALQDWQQAERLYRQVKDQVGVAQTILGEAEALSKMGFHRRACDRALSSLNLEQYRCQNLTQQKVREIITQAQTDNEPWWVDSYLGLSNSLLSMGKLSLAQEFAEAGQNNLSRTIQAKLSTQAKINLSLGNIHQAIALRAKAQSDPESFSFHSDRALQHLHQVKRQIETPSYSAYSLAAQLNELSLLIVSHQWSKALELANQIQLKPGSDDLYTSVQFANSLRRLQQHRLLRYDSPDIAEIYLNVARRAQLSGDSRIESYAWGNLGELKADSELDSELNNNLTLEFSPQQLFERALLLAQQTHSPEIAYRWQWRLGRIYRQQGLRTQAIASYEAALANLDSLRSDLVALEQEVQYEFKDRIEPVYRELVDLLLTGSPTEKELETARSVIEALQLAELDNYFQDACLTFETTSIDRVDPDAAIIYTILLYDRLETIVATVEPISHQPRLRHYSSPVALEQLEATIIELRRHLTEPDRTREVQRLSTQIYSWLLQSLMADLESQPTQTLVFVLDGLLRTIPVSVLYDGKQYLLEKYAIAQTPGLRLLNPKTSSRSLSFLAGGISRPLRVDNYRFAPLANVPQEMATLGQLDSVTLLDRQFTPSNLLDRLNQTSASVVHLATHGQFRANPQKTFLLMWQKLLTIKEFGSIIQSRQRYDLNPIELLVLSACDTAVGDRRGALGLAGVAVRSGALSTIATLWQINDESTAELMKHFYAHLQDNTKAEALRQAQLELWQRTDKDWQVPAFWSAYVMIGNWQ